MRWTWPVGLFVLGITVTGSGFALLRWFGSEIDAAIQPLVDRGLPEILQGLPRGDDRDRSQAFEARMTARFGAGTPIAVPLATLRKEGFEVAAQHDTWTATFTEKHCSDAPYRCLITWRVEWEDDGHGRVGHLYTGISRPEPPPNLGSP